MSTSKGTALVTGASSGIGAVYADRLADRGQNLILVARRLERLEGLAEQLRNKHGCTVQVVSADLSSEQDLSQVEALIGSAPDLRVLVNCAGLGALGMTTSIDPAVVDNMLKVNVVALTRLSLAAARRFSAAKEGTIINIGSIVAFMPVPGAGGYSGSKAYVLNFTRSLHEELAQSNVTVQVVMPGPVRSEFFGDKPAPFPDQLFISPEKLVDAALNALYQGEVVCYPTLHDTSALHNLDVARGGLVKALTQNGIPADRYTN
jgi:short-subunit dehydrogenase